MKYCKLDEKYFSFQCKFFNAPQTTTSVMFFSLLTLSFTRSLHFYFSILSFRCFFVLIWFQFGIAHYGTARLNAPYHDDNLSYIHHHPPPLPRILIPRQIRFASYYQCILIIRGVSHDSHAFSIRFYFSLSLFRSILRFIYVCRF